MIGNPYMELEKKNLLHCDRFSNYYSLHLSCRSVVPIFVIICFHVRRASKAAKVTLLLCIKWNAHLGHIVLKGSPVTLGEVGLVTACKTIASSKEGGRHGALGHSKMEQNVCSKLHKYICLPEALQVESKINNGH